MAAECLLELARPESDDEPAEDRRWVAAALLAEGLAELGILRRALTKPSP